ncbi:MAG TPA: hypothetical protein VFZ59_05520 [Verrucomicrobiae bacterium]|nr:hypothetical protein [Verrucomicrobiae bacterium]
MLRLPTSRRDWIVSIARPLLILCVLIVAGIYSVRQVASHSTMRAGFFSRT